MTPWLDDAHVGLHSRIGNHEISQHLHGGVAALKMHMCRINSLSVKVFSIQNNVCNL